MKKLISKIKVGLAGLLVLCFTLVIAFNQAQAQEKPKGEPWPTPATALKEKSPLKAPLDAGDLKEGKILYSQHCKSCHGSGGLGDGPKASKLDISCGDFTSDEFRKEGEASCYWKTTEGRKPMPSFKQKLSDKERWLVTAYIFSLEAKKK